MADLAPWRRQIEEALGIGWKGHTFEDIEALVADGSMQSWVRANSIVITQIIEYPQRKELLFFLGGGDLAGIEAIMNEVYEWARSLGCTVCTSVGRPGWQRTFMTRHGWAVKPLIIMEKAL